ncbi:ATP-dependent DNA helicase RecG [Corynebacterium aquatimens]|uniref:Probable DNA 3'-5' helicase RecG n=1 Tax=Corynebacterium aquatimens TaxID=1190508 RepID=A0A931DWM5_9CORY|nr:ATP-dependent DNA helicase RecG [Corynebacterium aquatimens]MBG6121460.1 ATP-dependent DNA helicase RecG [Corynebacterium aquatimens]WJY65996.1 ATP-dependent DNA helicase RecG [Corynebacterium aquatimens]
MLGLSYPTPLNLLIPVKQAAAIARHLKITTAEELLEHFPRRYLHYGSANDIENLEDGDELSVIGTVRTSNVQYTSTGKRMLKVDVTDGHTTYPLTFFNSKYAEHVLKPGVRAMFTGKIKEFNKRPSLTHPSFVILDSAGITEKPATGKGTKSKGSSKNATGSLRQLSHFGEPEEILAGKEWLAVYRGTSKASSWMVYGAVDTVLNTLPRLLEPFGETPEGFISFDRAVREVHQPSTEGPQPAIDRLKYNEALSMALFMALRRAEALTQVAEQYPATHDGYREALLNALPFPLTQGQQAVLDDIERDLAKDHPMSRLLQGEVGSGKTIVALIAMLQAIDGGAQAALLAPTEVLVQQHARSLQDILDRAGININVVALTGSLPAAQKQKALLDIMTNDAQIVVGTHALIQDSVEFFNLGLMVVDEQHRFGVEQRERLRQKGNYSTPHLLVMTATPIPRTVAITVFGDLEVSTLKELPGGRKPIKSHIVPDFFENWVERAWQVIRDEVAKGHQAYVVCPRIEGDGGVMAVGAKLAEEIFPDLAVEILHGRMNSEDKDAVMTAFADGLIDVLVSTTVIEVGVDVPNATVMMVRESEHFGLSQLHQLRGRIGRGGNQSMCFFHTMAERNTPTFNRIYEVEKTTDGFALAELDLRLRREGNVLGTSQSGHTSQLKLLNVSDDVELITRAYHDAEAIVARDPERARAVISYLTYEDFEYLNKT